MTLANTNVTYKAFVTFYSCRDRVQRNGSNLDFNGYKISLTSASDGDNACRLPADWISTNENDFVGSRFTKTESGGSVRITHSASDGIRSEAIGTNYPLSLLNGSCIFEINKAHIGWEVGLTRSLRTTREDPTRLYADDNLAYPSYYRQQGNQAFFDWSAKVTTNLTTTKNELSLFQTVWNNARQQLEKREFNYGTKVDLETANITKIAFRVRGERMRISTINNAGVVTDLVDGTTGAKATDMKPVSIVTSCMFPKIVQTIKNQHINLVEYSGVDITNWKYGSEDSDVPFEQQQRRQTNQDFWATQVNLNKMWVCKSIESRFMFDYDNATGYTQMGLNTGTNWVGATQNYFPVYIFTESQLYRPSKYAGISGLLGFRNNGVVTGNTQFTGRDRIVISPETPKFLSTNSMFVRVRDLAHESYNFSKGSISKILYHMPRFDNTGNEVGGLFFEPAERTYLDLNNAADMYINNLNVEICNSDETLANNLTGKTIITFHIRPKKI